MRQYGVPRTRGDESTAVHQHRLSLGRFLSLSMPASGLVPIKKRLAADSMHPSAPEKDFSGTAGIFQRVMSVEANAQVPSQACQLVASQVRPARPGQRTRIHPAANLRSQQSVPPRRAVDRGPIEVGVRGDKLSGNAALEFLMHLRPQRGRGNSLCVHAMQSAVRRQERCFGLNQRLPQFHRAPIAKTDNPYLTDASRVITRGFHVHADKVHAKDQRIS